MRTKATQILALGVAAALTVTGCSALHSATSASSSPAVKQSRGDSNPLSGSPSTSVVQWVAGSRGTVFSVGAHASDGAAAAIPPGRYQVRLTDAGQAGSWTACDTMPCGPSQAAALGNPVSSSSSAIDITPGTRNLLLTNVILTATEEPGIRR